MTCFWTDVTGATQVCPPDPPPSMDAAVSFQALPDIPAEILNPRVAAIESGFYILTGSGYPATLVGGAWEIHDTYGSTCSPQGGPVVWAQTRAVSGRFSTTSTDAAFNAVVYNPVSGPTAFGYVYSLPDDMLIATSAVGANTSSDRGLTWTEHTLAVANYYAGYVAALPGNLFLYMLEDSGAAAVIKVFVKPGSGAWSAAVDVTGGPIARSNYCQVSCSSSRVAIRHWRSEGFDFVSAIYVSEDGVSFAPGFELPGVLLRPVNVPDALTWITVNEDVDEVVTSIDGLSYTRTPLPAPFTGNSNVECVTPDGFVLSEAGAVLRVIVTAP